MKLATVAAAFVLAVPAAAAAQGGYQTDPTREQWVEQADAICKKPYQRADRRFKKLPSLAEHGRYDAFGETLIFGGKLLSKVNDRVAALARPPADADAIAAFLKADRRGGRLYIAAGEQYKQGKVKRGWRLFKRTGPVFERAFEHVKGFGLRECA